MLVDCINGDGYLGKVIFDRGGKNDLIAVINIFIIAYVDDDMGEELQVVLVNGLYRELERGVLFEIHPVIRMGPHF